ncbi:MAG: NAD(P)H-dependent flavin oxidoreductase [Reyranellaceae bacterium]
MPLPAVLQGRLSIPVVGSPMFIVSTPDLVIAQCKAGVVGSFPSLNARPVALLDEWLAQIGEETAAFAKANPGRPVAPFACNQIIHRSNSRLEQDLPLCIKHKVPIVITSVGNPTDIVKEVHAYGGVVFHDTTTIRHTEKAIEAGVDGVILVCAGAGGHAGTLSPFALVRQVRRFWKGTLLVGGAISDGAAVRAAQVLGADLAYVGSRFIATKEANAVAQYKQMLIDSGAKDITYTPAFSGVPANYLTKSIIDAGLDPANLKPKGHVDMDLGTRPDDNEKKVKAWKDIWSAGQGVGSIDDVPSVAELVERMTREYRAAVDTDRAVAAE